MRRHILLLALVLAVAAAWGLTLRRLAGWYGVARAWGHVREARRLVAEAVRAEAAQAPTTGADVDETDDESVPDTAATTATAATTTVTPPVPPGAPSPADRAKKARQSASERLAAARRDLAMAARVDPDNPYPDLVEGLARLAEGNLDGAREALASFAGRHPTDMGVFLNAWLTYRGDPGVDPFAGVELRDVPLSDHAALLCAWVALHRNDLPSTRQLLLRARGARDVSPEFHALTGLADAVDDRLDSAFENLRQARTLSFSRNRLPTTGLALDPFAAVLVLQGEGVRLERGPWLGTLVPAEQKLPRRSSELLYDLAVLNHVQGRFARSLLLVEIVSKHHPEDVAAATFPDLDVLRHPLAYRASVFNNAAAYNVDPWLVYAVMREESKFRPDARSPKGATGLMQITPETGQWICTRMRIRWREGMLEDPETNIRMGCWYLDYLSGKFTDPATRIPWILASYNAGLGNVERWMRRWKSRGRPSPVTRAIAYEETANYVVKVTASYEAYRRLHGGTQR